MPPTVEGHCRTGATTFAVALVFSTSIVEFATETRPRDTYVLKATPDTPETAKYVEAMPPALTSAMTRESTTPNAARRTASAESVAPTPPTDEPIAEYWFVLSIVAELSITADVM